MKKFIETIKNIFKIEELRKDSLYPPDSVYRFGSFVVIPGINPVALPTSEQVDGNGLLGC